jgi:all-trans-retinol dehydrogenase (NAD+)
MERIKEYFWYFVYLSVDLSKFFCLSIYYSCEGLVQYLTPRSYRYKSVVGEVVLVTGAGGGIGRLIAQKFAKLGATTVVWDIKKEGK